jgi:hypothetical protein
MNRRTTPDGRTDLCRAREEASVSNGSATTLGRMELIVAFNVSRRRTVAVHRCKEKRRTSERLSQSRDSLPFTEGSTLIIPARPVVRAPEGPPLDSNCSPLGQDNVFLFLFLLDSLGERAYTLLN